MYRRAEIEATAGPADASALSGGADRKAGPVQAGYSKVELPFRVGARTLASVGLNLCPLSVPLQEALGGMPPELPPLGDAADGYMLRALPREMQSRLAWNGRLRPFVRQSYVRYYTRLDQPFDTYIAGLSGSSRSALKRKLRKMRERCGGNLDIRVYRRPQEMEAFHAHARALSRLTYQERLLGAGLGEDALTESLALAAQDSVRAWLLFIDDRPASYLYMPAKGDTLIYHRLGYDPAFAQWSPGSVLQLEAIRMMTEEGRFRHIDFTEGDGQHKRQFSSGHIPSLDLMLLRPSLRNVGAASALAAFDRAVSLGRRALSRLGLEAAGRALLRRSGPGPAPPARG